MKIRIVDSSSELRTLEESWEELLSSCSAANIFVGFDWASTWWRHYGQPTQQLRVLTAHEGSHLVGLAPLMLEKRYVARVPVLSHLRFLGGDLADRHDLLLHAGMERSTLEVLIAQIFRMDWDVWDLDEIAEDSITARYVPELARRLGAEVEITNQSVCPVVTLPTHSDAYLECVDKEIRHKIRHQGVRLLRDHEVKVRFSEQEPDLARDIEPFLALYRAHFSSRSGMAHLTGESFAAFRRDIVLSLGLRARVLLALMQIDGTDVSAQLCFRYGQRYFEYNRCYDQAWRRENVGTLLLWHVLVFVIAKGASTYDFLRGDEDYKFAWGAESLRHIRIRVYRKNMKNALLRYGVRILRHRGVGDKGKTSVSAADA